MAVRYSIDSTRLIARGVFSAALDPAEVRALGRTTAEASGRSVIVLREMTGGSDGEPLNFAPGDIVSLAVGTVSTAIFVDMQANSQSEDTAILAEAPASKSIAGGDTTFVAACRSMLTPEMAELGEVLLRRIRRHHEGNLVEANNRKWVNRPRNFFTITPQIRNQSFRISIRGKAASHKPKLLQLKDGMMGYSEFILRSGDELDEAITLIMEAARRA